MQEQRCRHREHTCEHGKGRGESEVNWESRHLCTTVCKRASGKRCTGQGVQKAALKSWDVGVGRRFRKEGIYEYVSLIHFVVQQKRAQYGKVITL